MQTVNVGDVVMIEPIPACPGEFTWHPIAPYLKRATAIVRAIEDERADGHIYQVWLLSGPLLDGRTCANHKAWFSRAELKLAAAYDAVHAAQGEA